METDMQYKTLLFLEEKKNGQSSTSYYSFIVPS